MKGKTLVEGIKTIISSPSKKEAKQAEIGVDEAHTIWSLLTNRYLFRDQLNLIKNFTHDKDFIYIIKEHADLLDTQARTLERLLDTYSIMPSSPNTKDLNATGSTETMSDRRSAQLIFVFIKTDITTIARALRDTHVNDDIRQVFIDFIRKGLSVFDSYVKFLKMKDWIEMPPLYKYARPDKGQVGAAEIYLLWDHLVTRYHNIRLTQISVKYARDKDLKTILEIGLNILTKQATIIEDKLLSYGVTLPEHYTSIAPTPETTVFLEDKLIFNIIQQGVTYASILHINAIQEIVTSDDLRDFFIELAEEELSLVDKMRKYGKLKGWLYVTPKFTIGNT